MNSRRPKRRLLQRENGPSRSQAPRLIRAAEMFANPISEAAAMSSAVVVIICLVGIALSLKSIAVLGRGAPWTSAGWWFTVVYFIAVIARSTVAPPAAVAAEYIALAALAVAFVVAGVRDERQAEPWWWPNRRGSTRAEKAGTT